MAKKSAVWAIDIGQVALKALKALDVGGELQIEAFEVIDHPKILSQPDADRQQLIRMSLERFLARHDVTDCQIAVSVPGATGFTRFVKLPPVDAKKIPDIVRYEAEQQIPFPIGEVHWRWQPFLDPESPDVEVGIFAMKRADVAQVLDQLSAVGLQVDLVQMAPLALCNFMTYDGQLAEDGATLLMDVGADKTDLVVCDGPRIWTRTIQIGGNSFTDALVRAFKLSFGKAEKLKRTAATSKYARQVFQAMRPVFADLVQEVQRSIGYYTSLHRETRFRRLIGLGNGFRLPGLQKFLEQNLNVPVVRIDSYNRLVPGAAVKAPTFHDHVLSFAVAYGLAIQSLASPRVQTNLLPGQIVRKRMWNRKRPWFAAAAAILVLLFALPLFRALADRGTLAETTETYERARGIARDLQDNLRRYQAVINQGEDEKRQIEQHLKLYAYRDYWPSVLGMISQSIEAVGGEDQAALTAYAQARTDEARMAVLNRLTGKPRQERKLIVVRELTSEYLADVEEAGQPKAGKDPTSSGLPGLKRGTPAAATARSGELKRGFRVTLTVQAPCSPERVVALKQVGALGADLEEYSRKALKDFPSLGFKDFGYVEEPERAGVKGGAGTGSGADPNTGPRMPDPLFPDEDMYHDMVFKVEWILTIEGDGVPTLKEEPRQGP